MVVRAPAGRPVTWSGRQESAAGTDEPQRRFRYRQREASQPGDRQYDVQAQDRPRARWQTLGWVMGLSHEGGPASWAGLRDGADAWTEWKTRGAPLLRTWPTAALSRLPCRSRAREEAGQAAERMREQADADGARWREEQPHASGSATDLEAT